jgi:3-oxoacyl-[acyl-carrier protein] reductase
MKKNYLLSGASSGIGLAIYNRLIYQGHNVICILRDRKIANQNDIKEFIEIDYSDPGNIESILKNTDISIDAFINAAGAALGKPIWESSYEEINNIVNINLISPMLICGALKNKIKKGGCILLFSSQSAYKGGWDDAYNVSKGGINTLVKSLSLKYAPDIRVLGIAPGITLNTRMTNSRKENDLNKIIDTIPLRRFANVEEIAEMVDALLGNAGAYMTGAVIDMNGGNYLR